VCIYPFPRSSGFFFSPYSMSYTVQFSFSTFFSVSPSCFRSYSLNFSFSTFFSFSPHISGPTLCILIFHVLQCFLPYSRSSSVCFSFFMFLGFLAKFHVLQRAFLNFHIFQVSRNIPGTIVCIYHFPSFSVFLAVSRSYNVHFSFSSFFSFIAIFQVLHVQFSFCKFFIIFCHITGPRV